MEQHKTLGLDPGGLAALQIRPEKNVAGCAKFVTKISVLYSLTRLSNASSEV